LPSESPSRAEPARAARSWRPAATQRRLAIGVVLVALAIGTASMLLVDRYVRQDHAAAEARGLALAATAAQALASHVERTMEWVQTLHELGSALWIAEAHEVAATRLVDEHLARVMQEPRLSVVQVAVIDADGTLAWSTVRPFLRIDLSDREHFRVLRDGQREPYVSVPIIGRASGRASVQVTRPVIDEDRFAGVVVVSIDPLLMARDLAELSVVEGSFSTLLRADGTVLSRSHDLDRLLGMQHPQDTWQRILDNPRGSVRVARTISGQAALLAWRAVEGYPLVVTFGLPVQPLDEAAARLRRTLQVFVVAGTLALASFGLLVLTMIARRRDRAEAARADASRREVEHLLDALPGAAYRALVDADGNFTPLHLSAAAARITGWPLGAFGFAEGLLPPGAGVEPAERRDFFRRVHRTGEQVAEYRLRAPDGRGVWLREHCRLVNATEPGQAEVVGLLSDITAERQLKAKAMAGAKLATLGEIATGVAHELNQPCAAITLAADVAALELGRADPARLPAVRARLEDIAQQTMRMRRVIDHFRLFGRTEEGVEEPVSVETAVLGALTIVTGALNAAGTRASVALSPGLPPVRARQVALEQVLVNLLVNARDAMRDTPPERRVIEIAAVLDATAGQVVLTVRDHGSGVPQELLDRVFEPFFTTKPVGEGTGLGLSIAYGTIRGFGGSIALSNSDEGGAQVTIRLPRADTTTPRHKISREEPLHA
jgi:C4-dicarboxylate-specific signal transduction histidine kinase